MAMIEEAIADAYNEAEQATGWFTMLEERVAFPFETKLLGAAVTVTGVHLCDDGKIVANCIRAEDRQAIPLVGLPLPSLRPAGGEWIEAYRRWLGGR